MRNGIYIDCETTGLSENDRICELTLARVIDWKVIDMTTRRYNPGMPVSDGAAAINGLNWERDLLSERSFDLIAAMEIADALADGLPLVAYSCQFDRRMLEREFKRCGSSFPELKWIDACKEAKEKLNLPRYRQVDVAEHFGIDTTGSHTAERDVQILIDICRSLGGVQGTVVAQVGGDVPSMVNSAMKKFAEDLREAFEVTSDLSVVTEYDSTVANSAINRLQDIKNRLDKERKRIVAEPTKLVRAVNAEFKKVKDRIDQERSRLDKMVEGYLLKHDDIAQSEPTTATNVGSATVEKTYNIMYAHVDKAKVDMKFLKIDEFAIECEIKRQMAEGIDPPRIQGVPLESKYVVKRRAR